MKINIVMSKKAESNYEKLRKSKQKLAKIMLRNIDYKIITLKQNPYYGRPIAKKLIPKKWIIIYGIRNLFRVELSCFWRMFYTIRKKQDLVIFVIAILDHKQYNKIMKYKK